MSFPLPTGAVASPVEMAARAIHVFWPFYAKLRSKVRTSIVPDRNDACPCGSGRKYKRCCGSPLNEALHLRRIITHKMVCFADNFSARGPPGARPSRSRSPKRCWKIGFTSVLQISISRVQSLPRLIARPSERQLTADRYCDCLLADFPDERFRPSLLRNSQVDRVHG